MKAKKIIVNIALLSICAGVLAPLAASADETSGPTLPSTARTQGEVTFRVNENGGEGENPKNPGGGGELVPEEPEGGSTTGPLRMHVPGIRFMEGTLKSGENDFNAKWGKGKQIVGGVETSVYMPQFVQVIDEKGENKDQEWKVSVYQDTVFTSATATVTELPNTRIHLYENKEFVTDMKENETTDMFVTGLPTLTPGEGNRVIIPVKDQDTATSLVVFKSAGITNTKTSTTVFNKNYDPSTFYGAENQESIKKLQESKINDGTGLVDNPDFDKTGTIGGNTGVKLNVPGSDTPDANKSYITTLVWTLTAGE